MTNRKTPEIEKTVPFPNARLDVDAARRAAGAVSSLDRVLPEPSVSILAREVISRLAARGAVGGEDAGIAALADALCAPDEAKAMRIVMREISAGQSVESVYLTQLAGAARVLGARWTKDVLTSAQVTIAAARIYAIMRGLSASMTPRLWPDGRHAVFASVPGERHTLGVTMAADLFRRDGWLIDLKAGRSHDELMAELAQTDYAILGLSAATREMLPALIRVTAAVRVTAPHVCILVAGRLADLEPELKSLTDADGVSNKFDTLRAMMTGFHDTLAVRAGVAAT